MRALRYACSRKCPNQCSRPPKTLSRACDWRVPSGWSALTVGNVVTPCTRKALGFRNGTGRVISKGEPRKLVLHNRDEGAVLIPEAHATTHRFTGF